MISKLKNPKDLVICLKFLIHLSLTDEKSAKKIKNIIKKHIGILFEQHEYEVEDIINTLDDKEFIKHTIHSFNTLHEEEEKNKKSIVSF